MDDYISDIPENGGIPLRPSREEKKWIRAGYSKTGLSLLLQFIAVFALSQVAVFALYFIIGEDALNNNLDFISVLLTAILYGGTEILVFLIGAKLIGYRPKNMFHAVSPKYMLKSTALALMTGFTFSIIAAVIMILLSFLGYAPATPDIGITDDPAYNVVIILYVAIIGPIGEELLFRGFALKGFSKVSMRFGIIMSSVCFGLMHGNIQQLIFATALGIALATITVKSGSLIPAIIIHIVNNSFSMLESYLLGIDEIMAGVIAICWMGFWMGAGITVMIIEIVAWSRRKLAAENAGAPVPTLTGLPKDTPAQKKRTWSVFFTSVPCIIYLVAMIVVIALTFTPTGEGMFI